MSSIPQVTQDSIDLNYTLTISDVCGYYFNAQKVYYSGSRFVRILGYIVITVFLAFMTVILEWTPVTTILRDGWSAVSDPDVYTQVLTVPALAVFFAIAYGLINLGFRNAAKEVLKGETQEDLERTFHADADGFIFGGRQIFGKYRWSEVLRTNEDARVITFVCASSQFLGSQNGLKVIIPKRLFTSRADSKAVMKTIAQFRNTSAQTREPYELGLLKAENQIGALPFQPELTSMRQLTAARWREGKGRVKRIVQTAAASILLISWFAYIIFSDPSGASFFRFELYLIFPLFARYSQAVSGAAPQAIYNRQNFFRQLTGQPNPVGPHEFTFGPEQFIVSSVNGSLAYTWDIVDYVTEYKGSVVIDFKKGLGLVLPKSTFASETQLDLFYKLLNAVSKGEAIQLQDDPGAPTSWPPPPNWFGIADSINTR